MGPLCIACGHFGYEVTGHVMAFVQSSMGVVREICIASTNTSIIQSVLLMKAESQNV